MGDSDDEFDRRRRDKFRRERNDYERREGRDTRERGGGGQWEERGGRMGWDKRERREGYNRDFDRRRERYSPNGRQDISPPMKRFRGDWEDRTGGGGGGNFEGNFSGGHAHHGNWSGAQAGEMGPPHHAGFGNPQRSQEPEYPTQPPMMSFKQFLSSQDDNITDEESIKKYNEYKVDFKKQQINEFFLAHKEEEWFKAKYSPEDYEKRQKDATQALVDRCNVFRKLLEMGKIASCVVDVDHTDELVRLLDAAVILMEGGTDFDINVLDAEPRSAPQEKEAKSRQNSEAQASSDHEEGAIAEPKPVAIDKSKEDEPEDDEREEGEEEEDDDQEISKSTDGVNDPPPSKADKGKRRDYNSESGSESESGSGSESEAESSPKSKAPVTRNAADTTESPEAKLSKKEVTKKGEEKEEDTAAEEGEHKDDPKPQALHKTHSIFLRNLAPTITKQEVEAMCKRFPGFLRVALQDPQPERRFFRRGWVTFDRTVNIKEICWNLNNIRLRDCEMGAIVNRELKQRVRPVNGITAHKTITKQDIKHAAKIIQNFDNRWNLWPSQDEKKDDDKESKMSMSFGLVSNNPVLKNITDYLVDEGSYEEEAYFGECMEEKKEGNPEVTIEKDPELCQVLDRMILYLRIVHSFDYYSGVEYPNEDEMPHRCGIMHARGAPPPNRISQHDLNEWNSQYESRIAHYLNYKWTMDNEESTRLGRKDAEAEVEKFVTANTQELGKDKWLCPLSGKKFKGPEFIKKHLFNKHAEKVDEVRQEVAYFNNYLMDPKRPHLPEHPSSRQGVVIQPQIRQDTGPTGYVPHTSGYQGGGFRGNMGGGYSRPPMYNNYQGRGRGHKRGYHHSPNYHGRGGQDHYRQDFRRGGGGGGGGGSFYRRDRGRQDPRGIIEYRDLDAPEDSDIF